MTATPPKDRAALWLRLAPIAIVLVIVAAWLLLRGDGEPTQPALDETPPAAAEPPPLSETEREEPGFSPAQRRWVDVTGAPPEWPSDILAAGSCAEAVRDLRALCERLDRQPAVRELKLTAGTFALLEEVNDALAANPPVVEGELTDLLDIRANVAHVFRAIGEPRTVALLRIALAHPEFAEPMALGVYRWLRSAESCGANEPRPMRPALQYEYAAFLLDTVGGQGYLRRRAPRHEALASFYALLIVERAVRERRDLYAIRLGPEIDRCMRLIEGEPSLLFRDRYLETLRRIRPG